MNTLPCNNKRIASRPAVKRLGGLLLLTSIAASGAAHAFKLVIPLAGVTDNYAECVLGQVGPKVGPVETQSIKSDCRSRFPGPSKRGMLDPRTVQACYNKNESRVAHREAAEAVFGACQDYFRSASASQSSALRGSALK